MKISNIFKIEKGVLQSSKCTEGEYDFITASSEWKKHTEFTHDCEALIFAMGASGSLGRTHYVNGKFISSDLCFILTPKEEFKNLISMELYQYFFNFNKTKIVKSLATGTSKIAINRKRFSEYEIPFLSREQMDVNEIKSLIIRADKVNDDIQSSSDALLEDLSDFRKEILNRAFRGELTEQDIADGTGAELLQSIQLERQQQEAESKRKKKTELVPVEAGEEPYDVPENWVWTRFGEIVEMVTGKTPSTSNSKYWNEGSIPWISISDMKDGDIITKTNKKISPLALEETFHNRISPQGSLIMSFKLTIGKLSILGEDAVHNEAIITLNCNEKIKKEFIQYLAPYVSIKQTGTNAIMGKTLNSKILNKMEVPLPPLAEQHRIVEKIEAIFAQLDVMEEAIRLQKDEASKCYEEILRKSLEGTPELVTT